MQPTDILMNEHRIIEQVLNCLEKILEQCAAEKKLDTKSAKQAVEFFRNFADRCHHGKEEAQLFPMMQANGFSGGCSPVVVMLCEHKLGRFYLQGMSAAIELTAAGDSECLKRFVQDGQNYLKLLREHIHKEDTCLFSAANHRLTEKDQEQLMAAFEKFEVEEMGLGTHEACLQLANELADRFGVPRVTIGQPVHGPERTQEQSR
jgi:hemerythrin-like domain-containing protein